MAPFKNGKRQNKSMKKSSSNFSNNVFINCPFDSDFTGLLRPLIFTIIYLGYNPRIASERFDSGEVRINKICELIKISKYSIHDLSRIKSSKKNEFYRLNIPFELGIDIGYRLFNTGKAKSKKCLILEKEKYRYQKALSDLSNSDIKHHKNEPENIVREVRNWFVETDKPRLPSGTKIWEDFNEFMADFYTKRKKEGFKKKDLQMMPVPELVSFKREWLKDKCIL
jgi:hypothetical protein